MALASEAWPLSARYWSNLVDFKFKQWRKAEYDADRPSGFDDYLAAHDICLACRGEGVHMIGWSDLKGSDEVRAAAELNLEQLPVYAVRPQCGGRGTSPNE